MASNISIRNNPLLCQQSVSGRLHLTCHQVHFILYVCTMQKMSKNRVGVIFRP